MIAHNGTENPAISPPAFAAVPTCLTQLTQWVNWREEDRSGKRTKVPIYYAAHGRPVYASSTDPETWRRFDEVVAASPKIGLVFAKDGGLVGIDLDHCVVDGEIAPWAREILDHFPGAYVEFSPSGTGLHIICRGMLPKGGRRTAYEGGVIEIYNQSRYFTVTGNSLTPCEVIADCQDGVDLLLAQYMDTASRASRQASTNANGSGEHGRWWRAADITINPDADVPLRKFQLLKAADAHFEATWTRKRRMPKDSSNSGYDMAIADAAAACGWSAQDICDLLVSFRREHSEDLKAQNVQYYQRTIHGALERAALQTQEPPEAGSTPAEYLEWLRAQPLFDGLGIVQVVKLGREEGEYRLLLEGDTAIELGTAADTLNPLKVQAAIFDATGRAIALPKRAQWAQFATAIGLAADVIDTGSGRTASLNTWLAAWVRGYPCGNASATIDPNDPVQRAAGIQAATERMFAAFDVAPRKVRLTSVGFFWTSDEHRLVFSLTSFMVYLGQFARHTRYLMVPDCTQTLARLGFTRRRWKGVMAGKKEVRARLWESPKDFDPEA